MATQEQVWEVGDRVYIWGKHHTIQRVETRSGLEQALAVPDGREKPSPFDWINVSLLNKHGVRSGEPS